MPFMGQKDGEYTTGSVKESKSPEHPTEISDKEFETDGLLSGNINKALDAEEKKKELKVETDANLPKKAVGLDTDTVDDQEVKSESLSHSVESHEHKIKKAGISEAVPGESLEIKPPGSPLASEEKSKFAGQDQGETAAAMPDESNSLAGVDNDSGKGTFPVQKTVDNIRLAQLERRDGPVIDGVELSDLPMTTTKAESVDVAQGVYSSSATSSEIVPCEADAKPGEIIPPSNANEIDVKEQHQKAASDVSDYPDTVHELERVKMEMKMMETALQGAARQAQVCACP